jgi:hypothetical protein
MNGRVRRVFPALILTKYKPPERLFVVIVNCFAGAKTSVWIVRPVASVIVTSTLLVAASLKLSVRASCAGFGKRTQLLLVKIDR